MLLRVLGTAAGGGLPQWNCACPGCSGARTHPERRRRHAALAVRTSSRRWYLVNAPPDLGEQIESCTDLQPPVGTRDTPLATVLLTDAELDHTLGLARLREAGHLDIWSTGAVSAALREQLRLDAVLSPYTRLRWRSLTDEPQPQPLDPEAELLVSAIPVSAKRPRYAQDAPSGPDRRWVVALRLHEPATGATALYAPALASWNEKFQEAAEDADLVIVDGTFWDDQEPIRTGISTRTSTEMGHLPITGPSGTGTAERLVKLDARCLYTHLNNTNPLNDPHASGHRALADLGLRTATEGLVIEL